MKHGGATVFLVALVQISAFKPDADPQLLPESSGRDYSLSRDWAADFRLWVRLILGLAVAWATADKARLLVVDEGLGRFALAGLSPNLTVVLKCNSLIRSTFVVPTALASSSPCIAIDDPNGRFGISEVWHQSGLAPGLLEFT